MDEHDMLAERFAANRTHAGAELPDPLGDLLDAASTAVIGPDGELAYSDQPARVVDRSDPTRYGRSPVAVHHMARQAGILDQSGSSGEGSHGAHIAGFTAAAWGVPDDSGRS